MEATELNTVLSFIENWQKNNPYNSSNLESFNCKFKADLKAYFEKSHFSTITVNEIIN